VLTDVSWYIYSDPLATREIVKRIEGTPYEVRTEWTPERRAVPWFRFQFDVDPFSVHVRSPSERLQTIMQMYQTIIMPMMEFMLRQGIHFDIESFWRLMIRYTGLHEIADVLKSSGDALTGEPKEDYGEMPKKSPFSQREYVRRNVGSGGQMQGMNQGPGQQALQMMMAAGGDGGAAVA